MRTNNKGTEKLWGSYRLVIYIAISLFFSLLGGFFIKNCPDTPGWAFPAAAVILFIGISLYLIILDYVYHDAKRRSMNPWLWIIIVAIIPYFLGFVIYLLIRTTFSKEKCPQCGYSLRSSYAFCPQCGKKIKAECPKCHKAVEPHLHFCPYCGHKLTGKNKDR